jgi:hypothetical protein
LVVCDLVLKGWKSVGIMKSLQRDVGSGHRKIVFLFRSLLLDICLLYMDLFFLYFRIDVWWRSKNQDAMLQGYKIDLQHMVGSKLPVGLLKFYYRFSFRRRVRYRLLSFLLRVTASGEKFCREF